MVQSKAQVELMLLKSNVGGVKYYDGNDFNYKRSGRLEKLYFIQELKHPSIYLIEEWEEEKLRWNTL
jgi:hypothetical protein